MTTRTFRAFHGTRADHLDSIVASGIRPSRNVDDWLGAGTYFFIDGLDDPRVSAFEWARAKLWDKQTRSFVVDEVAVLEVEIKVQESGVFDLREAENARQFHRARRLWLKRRVPRRSTHLARPLEPSYDTSLLDEFKRDRAVAALISDFHIQFSVRERHFRLDSRIPNVSVLCLTDPLVVGTTVTITHVDVLEPTSVLESELDT